MTPYLAVVPADIDALTALQPGLAIGLAQTGGADGAGIRIDGVPLTADDLLAGLVAAVILSETGRPAVSAFCAAWVARFGGPGPALIDLAATDPSRRQMALQHALVGALVRDRQASALRAVGLRQDLAQMRLTFGRTQEAFAQLEDHIYRHALADRHPSVAIDPPEDVAPLLLSAGVVLEQRLPRSSQGLCDVAVLIATPDATPLTDGSLRVSLLTHEDAETHAVWQIPAARLQPGWMRLSLHSALPSDARTAVLRMEWAGATPLPLAQAMRHPDPRFQTVLHAAGKALAPDRTGRVLALRLWSFVPGCAAPAPSDGLFPGGSDGRGPVRRRMVSAETLSQAVNLRPANQPYLYLPDSRSLLLHISPVGPSVGVMAGVVPDQTTRISAKIMTRATGASPIEYAFAVAPAAGVPVPGAELPAFDPAHHTEWHRLPAMVEGELHLELPAPLDGAHDLYMITRLPKGVEDASWGWATFSAFRLML